MPNTITNAFVTNKFLTNAYVEMTGTARAPRLYHERPLISMEGDRAWPRGPGGPGIGVPPDPGQTLPGVSDDQVTTHLDVAPWADRK